MEPFKSSTGGYYRVVTDSEHACVPDRTYPQGVMACACGQFWVRPSRDFLRFAFVSPDLLARLRSYQAEVRFGDAMSIAEAVAAAARRSREEHEAAIAASGRDWQRDQAARAAKYRRRIRAIVISRPCAYCGDAATDVDHIIPRSRGGSGRMRNLAAACARCNSEKGARTPGEWKAWRLGRGRPWPPLPVREAA